MQSDSVDLGRGWDSLFLTGAQVRVRLVHEPHFESQGCSLSLSLPGLFTSCLLILTLLAQINHIVGLDYPLFLYTYIQQMYIEHQLCS